MIRRLCEANKHDLIEDREKTNEKHDEYQYINLIRDISNHGELIKGRNGSTYVVYGGIMHFSLNNNVLPLLTTKRVAYKTCIRELLWFISGNTSNKTLQNKNVKIWNGNADPTYLESIGLSHYKEGDLGPIYGHQWRHFNAKYTGCDTDYAGQGVDQLQYIVDLLKSDTGRVSRRIIMSAWNPCQISEMALPPCHVLAQFHVGKDNKLSCSLYQRSADIGLGVPFNIASYSLLTHLLAHHCGLEAGDFYHHLGNCHIYDDHLDVLHNQLNNKPLKFPLITFAERKDNINDYTEADFIVHNYVSAGVAKMKMRT